MTDPDSSDPSLQLYLPRVSPELWVALSLLVGAAPWVVLGLLQISP